MLGDGGPGCRQDGRSVLKLADGRRLRRAEAMGEFRSEPLGFALHRGVADSLHR